jgi:murein DD-endopeptidase MepM/ murein hydrolase activator NlpD
LWAENPQFYAQFKYSGVPLRGHNGIDFLTPVGTNLLAVDNGQVIKAGFEANGFGNYILIQHSWGQSLYAHLNSIIVREGQSVARGQYIGDSGNTGASSGPHLHFGIRINPHNRADGWGGFSDPLPYLNPNDYSLPAYVRG